MSSANIQESRICFSTNAQTDIFTASGSYMSITSIAADPLDISVVSEDDAKEIGKGDEFATQNFLTSWNATKKLQVYASAEMLGWAAGFGLGSTSGGAYIP